MLKNVNSFFKHCFFRVLLMIATGPIPDVSAQNNLPDHSFSIEVKDRPLDELLATISEKSGVTFSYNPKKISAEKLVSFSITNQTVTEILELLSKRFDIAYTLVENQVILKPKKRKEQNTQSFTISGTVTDVNNGEALIGATLILKEIQTGTTTNPFGFFSITVPKGTYHLVCSYLGYREIETPVNLQSHIKEDLSLHEDVPVLQEIVITNTLTDVVHEIRSGTTNIKPDAIVERPAFFGEMDVVKSLESLPGIKLHSDGSTFYYVRGGNRDQNLLLIDDAPIYNPSHLLGLFSTVIPDAINDVTMYKGDMPASLGGRISSVLDIRTKKGNDQHFQAWGNAGLISTKIGIEGPIKKNESSFLLTTRISRLKWITQLADRNVDRFNFYDLTAKLNFKINRNNRLLFSFYSGADNFFGDNRGISWTNTATTLRWNHLFSDRLFLNTTVAASGYDYFLYANVKTDTKWNSHISNFNLKTDLSYFINPENELTFGFSLNGYSFNPGNLQSNTQTPSRLSLSVKNSAEIVLYGNHELKITERLGINYGLRFSSWTNTGEAFEFIFDDNRNAIDTLYFNKGENYKTYFNAEPRITLSYLLNENASVKTSYSRNIQNIHLISNSISPFTSLEVWLPSSINIKPQRANQLTTGYYRTLPASGLTFSSELFYKKMLHQIDYTSHAETLLNPLLEGELLFGNATAYGFEFVARKDEGRLRGLAGYTYSRARNKFSEINQGNQYNAFYDRPHQINFMLAYDLTLRWNLGINWIYSTGAPFSAPISFYDYNGEEVPVYGQKNNERLPDYHRLDLSATLRLNKNPEKKYQHHISFSIYNFYARKNALFINYNKTLDKDGNLKISSNLLDTNRLTSQFYLFQFTPSVSYNFKWR